MRKLTLILCALLLFVTGCEKKLEIDTKEKEQISSESDELNSSEKEEIIVSNEKEDEQSEVSVSPVPIVTPVIDEEPNGEEIIKEHTSNEDFKEEVTEEIIDTVTFEGYVARMEGTIIYVDFRIGELPLSEPTEEDLAAFDIGEAIIHCPGGVRPGIYVSMECDLLNDRVIEVGSSGEERNIYE